MKKKEECVCVCVTESFCCRAEIKKILYVETTDEWIKKWYIYTMEYYSAIKRNAFEPVLMRWMNLGPTIQSEVSQKEKYKYHILMHINGI